MADNPAMVSMGILALFAALWSVPGAVRARRLGLPRLAMIGWIAIAVIVVMAVIMIVVGLFG
ncbi:hypothetical protein [Thermomicrobium sp.]